MTQEEKELLLKDLSIRLPYGVYIKHTPIGITGKLNNINVIHIYNNTNSVQEVEATTAFFGEDCLDITYFKPYLRPMSSMTEEEIKEFYKIENILPKVGYICPSQDWYFTVNGYDWLNSHHFDYRGLIEHELAIAITEENNPYKE